MKPNTARLSVVLLLANMLFIHAGVAHAGKAKCCINAQGRNVCGDILPQECYGRAYREISERGITLRQVEAPLTAEQRAQRDRENERKKKAEAAAQEDRRRNAALLNTYATERDIDFMRDHTLEPMRVALKETEAKRLEAQKRKKKLEGELEFYTKKAPPMSLKEQIKTNESDLKALSILIDAKNQEMEQVRAKFAEEKQRFNQLTQGQSQGSSGTQKFIPIPLAQPHHN